MKGGCLKPPRVPHLQGFPRRGSSTLLTCHSGGIRLALQRRLTSLVLLLLLLLPLLLLLLLVPLLR